MPPATLRKFEIGMFLLALVLWWVFLRGWMLEREARNTATGYAKAQEIRIAELEQEAKASQAADAGYRAQMVSKAASVTTPEQAVKIITQYLPAPPTPAGAPAAPPAAIPVVPAADLSPAVLADLPPAPSYAILTPAQTLAIAKNDLACDADRHSLAACTVQLSDAQQGSKINANIAATWKQAAVGGTVFQRVGRVLKYAGCAGGGAVIASFASRGMATSSTQYGATALGAAGGVIACSLF